MLKHVEDDGALSVLITDDGETLLVCEAHPNEHMWLLNAVPTRAAAGNSRDRLASAIRQNPAAADGLHPGADGLIAALEETD